MHGARQGRRVALPNGGTVNSTRITRTTRLALSLLAAGCGEPPPGPTPFALDLQAASANGTSVAGVRAWADGDDLGTTSAGGSLRAELRGREGQAVTLTVACPPGFRTPEPRRRLVLQHLSAQRATPGTKAPIGALALRVACEPTERSAVLIVRARAREPLAGVPIRRDGVVVGQTDLDGTAHLLLRVQPASSLRIGLDTAAWPALVPRDPVQNYEIGDEDSILLVDRTFAIQPAAPAHAPRTAPKPSAASADRLPYRIR